MRLLNEDAGVGLAFSPLLPVEVRRRPERARVLRGNREGGACPAAGQRLE